LAPFYDLICTRVYPDLTDRMAMRIGGENRPDWMQSRHWERFSAEINIKPRLILQTLRKMAQRIIPQADALAKAFTDEFGPSAIVGKILDSLKHRASRITNFIGR